jgi:hypothetical protein
MALDRDQLLWEQYKSLVATLERHLFVVYSVSPALLTLIVGVTSIMVSKEVDAGARIYILVAGEWGLAFLILGVSVSHAFVSTLALHVIALEHRLNNALGFEYSPPPTVKDGHSFIRARGLSYHSSLHGHGLRELFWFPLYVITTGLAVGGGNLVALSILAGEKSVSELLWVAAIVPFVIWFVCSWGVYVTDRRVRTTKQDVLDDFANAKQATGEGDSGAGTLSAKD